MLSHETNHTSSPPMQLVIAAAKFGNWVCDKPAAYSSNHVNFGPRATSHLDPRILSNDDVVTEAQADMILEVFSAINDRDASEECACIRRLTPLSPGTQPGTQGTQSPAMAAPSAQSSGDGDNTQMPGAPPGLLPMPGVAATVLDVNSPRATPEMLLRVANKSEGTAMGQQGSSPKQSFGSGRRVSFHSPGLCHEVR